MSAPQVSIIIAPHNGMKHIAACLDSLFKQEYKDVEIIVVDNASSDGTGDFIEEHYPIARVIRSDQNLAYAGGNNLGASVARGTYLLFLNHDTIVSDGFLAELTQTMRSHPEIGIAQSRIMMASARDRIDSIGAYLTRTGMWVHAMRGETFEDAMEGPADVLGACGACLMVRRDLFTQLGGFDEDFMIYFEDADLSLRARLHGYRVAVVPQSVIYHWGGVTTSRLPSAFTVYHSFKNRINLLIKDLAVRDLLFTMPVHVSLCILGLVAYLLRLKPRSAWAIASSLIWNLRNFRRTLKKRKDIMREGRVDSTSSYRDLLRPLPLDYFLRTSIKYISRW